MTVHRFPFDDNQPLKRSYTVFCTPQTGFGCRSAVHTEPLNKLLAELSTYSSRTWRGNVLVVRSKPHSGQRDKYAMGVSDMTERDVYVATALVRA